ncbi:MAG: TolB family protein [Rhodothermales bacterium]
MKFLLAATYLLSALLLTAGCQQEAPEPTSPPAPSPDIWLYEISDNDVQLVTRVTDRNDYDNQPAFTADSEQLFFTSDRAGRYNAHLFDIATATISQVTFTDADKYSPTPIPGTNDTQISMVHTDSSAFQELWRYTVDGSAAPAPITDVNAVAYFTWAGDNHVLFWRLGETNTLQLLNAVTGDTTILDVGRVESLQQIPGEAASSYIIKKGEAAAEIKRFDWATQESSTIVQALDGSRYFCWTPDGKILMISDNQLFSFHPGEDSDWQLMAVLEINGGTRLAVSPNGKLLAVVGSR